MAELRYDPLMNDWVIVASHRQDRPQMPKDYCPFCPEGGRVPRDYTVLKYDNDFPALSQTPPAPDDVATAFFQTRPAYGKCEVILYSPRHTATLAGLPLPHVEALVGLWRQRFVALSKDRGLAYIFIFENKGEEVGVTMPHPHGQIYGYGVLPKRIAEERKNSRAHFEETGHCLICDLLAEETRVGTRVIAENDEFTAVLPFFSHFAYGVYIIAKRHIQNLAQFTDAQTRAFAQILRDTTAGFDALFDRPFPYMMCLYQNPTWDTGHDAYSHFHVKFFPPLRSGDKQQFRASSETGAWACCNPTAPEDKAFELRAAYERRRQV